MVTTRCDIEQHFLAIIAKDRRDQGNVRQMRATVIRVVEHIDIARFHFPGVVFNHGLNRFTHRTKVDRHMRGVGDQKAFLIKHRTREVQTFLDVDGI